MQTSEARLPTNLTGHLTEVALGDWRWMEEVETTPWYPTARLLRQREPGDWAGVVDRVVGELIQLSTYHGMQTVGAAKQPTQPTRLIPA